MMQVCQNNGVGGVADQRVAVDIQVLNDWEMEEESIIQQFSSPLVRQTSSYRLVLQQSIKHPTYQGLRRFVILLPYLLSSLSALRFSLL